MPLLIPQTGFLPPDDPWVIGLAEAVPCELVANGGVLRHLAGRNDSPDGSTGSQGPALAYSFRLADAPHPLHRTAAER